MNVLIINGSARKDGFCNHIANLMEKEFKRKGKIVNVSYYNISDKNVAYLGFFHHLNHHSSMDEETEKINRKAIKDITNKVIKQKIDYKKVMSSKNAYKV